MGVGTTVSILLVSAFHPFQEAHHDRVFAVPIAKRRHLLSQPVQGQLIGSGFFQGVEHPVEFYSIVGKQHLDALVFLDQD